MHEMTRILKAIQQGAPGVANQPLPLVYDGLRRLAASRLAQESSGQPRRGSASLLTTARLHLCPEPLSRPSPALILAGGGGPGTRGPRPRIALFGKSRHSGRGGRNKTVRSDRTTPTDRDATDHHQGTDECPAR
jgi:hypothetical protein